MLIASGSNEVVPCDLIHMVMSLSCRVCPHWTLRLCSHGTGSKWFRPFLEVQLSDLIGNGLMVWLAGPVWTKGLSVTIFRSEPFGTSPVWTYPETRTRVSLLSRSCAVKVSIISFLSPFASHQVLKSNDAIVRKKRLHVLQSSLLVGSW